MNELRWVPYREFGPYDPSKVETEPPEGPVVICATSYAAEGVIVHWRKEDALPADSPLEGDERITALEEIMRRDPGAAMMTVGLLLASSDRNYSTMRQLSESHKSDSERLRAELACVHARVGFLISGTYMPTPQAIERALNPPADEIEKRQAEMAEDRERS